MPILITALNYDNLFQAQPFIRICAAKALVQLKDQLFFIHVDIHQTSSTKIDKHY